MSIDELYTLLKAKVTGQVINDTLTGVLLESDLEEIYKQIKREDETDI